MFTSFWDFQLKIACLVRISSGKTEKSWGKLERDALMHAWRQWLIRKHASPGSIGWDIALNVMLHCSENPIYVFLFGNGVAQPGGKVHYVEYRTLGGVIPHQGGARGSAGLGPKRRGGPFIKICLTVVVLWLCTISYWPKKFNKKFPHSLTHFLGIARPQS